MPQAPEPPTEPDASRGLRVASSRRWLFVAIGVTALCLLVLALEFANLLSLPTVGSGLNAQPEKPTEGTLVVAVARTPGGPGEWSNWARIISALESDLGTSLTVRYLAKEDEAAKIIAKDEVDIAFVCAHHYVDLSEEGASEGLVTPVIDGSTMSTSMLVVRVDDPANGIVDLKDSVVAVSDKSSLGGYAYLSYLVKQRGAEPAGFFSELRLGETQEQNLRDVLEGSARATVINSAQIGSLDVSGVRVIEESEPFGCPPVVVRSDMDPDLKSRIRAALLEMDMASVLPTGSAIEGFEPLDPAEYAFARELRGACAHHAEDQ